MSDANKIAPSPQTRHVDDLGHIHPPILRRDFNQQGELSFAQEGLWALCQMEMASQAYVVPTAWRLKGRLNFAALDHSFREVFRRHESLRTVFHVVGGAPVSKITDSSVFGVEYMDLQTVVDEPGESEAQRAIDDALRRPMDITQGPLFRGLLIQLRPDEYILVITIHHLVADGTSLGVIVSEIEALYQAFCTGTRPQIPELPLQYADFVAWQRKVLTPELLNSQTAYWKHELAGAPPLIQLPTDRLRPAVQTFRGDIEYFALGKELTAGILDTSRRCGVTVFTVVYAALQTLLHRYTDSEDIISACQTHGRERQELQGMIGYFAKPMILRTAFAGHPTFLDILKSVRAKMRQAYAHLEVPFEEVVKALQPERSPSYNPIFQVILAQQKASWLTLKLTGTESHFIPVSNGAAKCDLHFYIIEGAEELTGWLEFRLDIFDRQTIQRMVGHLRTLLTNAIAKPSQPVAALSLMSSREMEEIVVGLNDTAAEFPSATIHGLFESQVIKNPRAQAFLFENDALSFEELNCRANQLAHVLKDIGVKRGMRVGVSMRRSLELPIALLAILKAGAAYVTLDTTYPEDRLAYIVSDAGIKLLICDSVPSWATTILGLRTMSLPALLEFDKIGGGEGRDVPTEPDDAAYIIYTSGSTGRPKGVVASHKGTFNRLAWMWKAYPYSPGEVNSAKTSLNFVDSVGEIWGALLQGVPTVLLSDDVIRDPFRLVQALASNRVSRIIVVPSLLRALLETGEDLCARLPHLQYWMSSGEILPVALLKHFQQALPNRTLLNLYGSSEIAAGDATCYDARNDLECGSVPIGRPIWNTQIYILDSAQQPVPVGVPGEIYIAGIGLTSGYLNLPELTTSRFLENPFSKTGNNTLFRTGDRARYLADGNIQFLGRMDNQVKVRGFRVELGEIESWLSLYPGVQQAVAVAFDDAISNKRIVAYVVPRFFDTPDGQQAVPVAQLNDSAQYSANADRSLVTDLRSFLESNLPAHMVPSALILVDSLPLLPNGKVDRRALRDPDVCDAPLGANHVTPRDALERQLAEIWQRSLGIQEIGIHDDFFALGGHSLLAVSVLRQVEKTTGKRMPLIALLQAPTIERFANSLRRSGWTTPPVVAVQAKGARPAFFCVYDRIDYGNLEGVLGQDQPVYVLPFDHMFDTQIKRDFLDVTRDFVSRIRNMQPEGPYYIGGMCLGGRIAFSIGCELYRQDQTVGLLAIIDSPAPGFRSEIAAMPWQDRLRYFLLDEIEFEWEILKTMNLRQKIETIKETLKLDAARYTRRFRWRIINGMHRLLDNEVPAESRDSFHLMRETAADYCPPEPYPGKVTLFRPAQRPGKAYRPEGMGWEKFPVGALEIHEIPGRHIEMLRKPNVETLGRILSERLIRAQAEAYAKNLPNKTTSQGNRSNNLATNQALAVAPFHDSVNLSTHR